jgi:DNA-binding SARP family transcriptional activator
MPFPPVPGPLASSGYNFRSPPASASPTHGAAPSPLGSPWRLRLLGSFSLERGGERVCCFGSRLGEQLLACLALHAPTAVARRELVSLFWPLIATATALKNLSVTLFAIRKRLQEEGLPADVIAGARQSLRLDPLLAVDV